MRTVRRCAQRLPAYQLAFEGLTGKILPMDVPPPRHDGRLAHGVILLSYGHLLAFADRAKVAGALPAMREQVAMSDQAAGWVIGTAFALSYGATLLALAALSRSYGAQGRLRMPCGVLLWALASAATGLADSLPALIGARVVLGIGQALFIPAALSYLVEASADRRVRATSMSIYTSAASLGRSIGLLIIGAALTFVQIFGVGGASPDWRWAFLLTALFNLILLAWLVRADLGGRAADPQPAAVIRAAIPRLLWCGYLVLAVAPVIVIQAMVGWLPSLFVRDLQLDVDQASLWLGALFMLGGPSGPLLGGWLLRRAEGWSGAIPLIVAGGIIAAVPAFALIAWGGSVAAAALGTLVAYVVLGVASFSALFGWQNLMPAGRRVAGNGLFLALITVVGAGLGPLITGGLADGGSKLGIALIMTALGCALLAIAAAAVTQPLYRKFRLA